MTAIAVIAVIVGSVWAAVGLLRGSLLAGCVLYLVVAGCFGPYFLEVNAGVTLTLDRLLLVGLLATFLVQWRLGKLTPRPWTKVDLLAAALVAMLAVSMFAHDWRAASLGPAPVIQHLINGYLIPLVLYVIARQAALTERNVSALLGMFTVYGVYLAATGLAEAAGAWSLVFPRYIADPDIGLHFGRARGPMVHSVSFGVYLATALVAAWLWQDRLPRWGQLGVWLAGPAYLAAIFATKTRSVWAGAGCGLLVVLAGTLPRRWRMLVIASAVLAALSLTTLKLDSLIGLQREGTVADTVQSTTMRGGFAYVSWLMFVDRPWFGFGFGQFYDAKMPYLADRNSDLVLEHIRGYVHHNTFLALLTETGLVGLSLYVALLAAWGWDAWRLARAPAAPAWMRRHGLFVLALLAIVLFQQLAHEITFMPYEHALLFMMAGVAVSLRWQTAGQQATGRSRAAAEFRPAASPAAPAR